MDMKDQIEALWRSREDVGALLRPEVQKLLADFLDTLDSGAIRVAEKKADQWMVHEWVKQGILLLFRGLPNQLMEGNPPAYDKIPLKCTGWDEHAFQQAAFRMVPGSMVRKGVYISPGAVIMPSFINIGAFVGKDTMIDSAVRVGSCAQIGQHCHISDGVGIGGVLEPLQAAPVIVEDDCFIGAKCQVVEGVHIGQGCVLGMGVSLGASTKIVHRESGKIWYGHIPPYSVVVPGSIGVASSGDQSLSTDCAIIVKTVDAQTRRKTEINLLLRS